MASITNKRSIRNKKTARGDSAKHIYNVAKLVYEN